MKFKIRAPRKWVSDLAGGNFDFRWTATSLANAVFKHDIPGMYCRFIDGLRVHGLTLEWANDLPDYFSDGIECEDFNNFDLEGYEGRQAPTTSATAAIVLRRGHGVSIRNSKAATGTSTFLSTSGVTGEGLFAENDLRSAKRVFGGGAGKFILFGNALPSIAKRPEQAGRGKR
jgi:hypothetical protein